MVASSTDESLRSIKWNFGEVCGASVLKFGRNFNRNSSGLQIGDVLLAINGISVSDKAQNDINNICRKQQDISTWLTFELAAPGPWASAHTAGGLLKLLGSLRE